MALVIPPIEFKKGAVELIDQTRLPAEHTMRRLTSVDALCESIISLRIRGAPALGIAGAYGLLLAIEEEWGGAGRYFFDGRSVNLSQFPADATFAAVRRALGRAADRLVATRPTAVNLGYAIQRMQGVYSRGWDSVHRMLEALHREALAIYDEDLEMCKAIGRHGAALLDDGARVLTHCNTGGLATSGYGTALGVVFAAVESGKKVHVFADETRPLLQGSRLNAWECLQRGIPVSVLCDGAAASLMSRQLVDCVIVGADRIARNGDTANKIGTLSLAIAASAYGVPFYVAAPSSTIDLTVADGAAIPIEERPEDEVKRFAGFATAPEGTRAVNPAFDVTPHRLITGYITEDGVVHPPFGA